MVWCVLASAEVLLSLFPGAAGVCVFLRQKEFSFPQVLLRELPCMCFIASVSQVPRVLCSPLSASLPRVVNDPSSKAYVKLLN